jgi:hypothetical protein
MVGEGRDGPVLLVWAGFGKELELGAANISEPGFSGEETAPSGIRGF